MNSNRIKIPELNNNEWAIINFLRLVRDKLVYKKIEEWKSILRYNGPPSSISIFKERLIRNLSAGFLNMAEVVGRGKGSGTDESSGMIALGNIAAHYKKLKDYYYKRLVDADAKIDVDDVCKLLDKSGYDLFNSYYYDKVDAFGEKVIVPVLPGYRWKEKRQKNFEKTLRHIYDNRLPFRFNKQEKHLKSYVSFFLPLTGGITPRWVDIVETTIKMNQSQSLVKNIPLFLGDSSILKKTEDFIQGHLSALVVALLDKNHHLFGAYVLSCIIPDAFSGVGVLDKEDQLLKILTDIEIENTTGLKCNEIESIKIKSDEKILDELVRQEMDLGLLETWHEDPQIPHEGVWVKTTFNDEFLTVDENGLRKMIRDKVAETVSQSVKNGILKLLVDFNMRRENTNLASCVAVNLDGIEKILQTVFPSSPWLNRSLVCDPTEDGSGKPVIQLRLLENLFSFLDFLFCRKNTNWDKISRIEKCRFSILLKAFYMLFPELPEPRDENLRITFAEDTFLTDIKQNIWTKDITVNKEVYTLVFILGPNNIHSLKPIEKTIISFFKKLLGENKLPEGENPDLSNLEFEWKNFQKDEYNEVKTSIDNNFLRRKKDFLHWLINQRLDQLKSRYDEEKKSINQEKFKEPKKEIDWPPINKAQKEAAKKRGLGVLKKEMIKLDEFLKEWSEYLGSIDVRSIMVLKKRETFIPMIIDRTEREHKLFLKAYLEYPSFWLFERINHIFSEDFIDLDAFNTENLNQSIKYLYCSEEDNKRRPPVTVTLAAKNHQEENNKFIKALTFLQMHLTYITAKENLEKPVIKVGNKNCENDLIKAYRLYFRERLKNASDMQSIPRAFVDKDVKILSVTVNDKKNKSTHIVEYKEKGDKLKTIKIDWKAASSLQLEFCCLNGFQIFDSWQKKVRDHDYFAGQEMESFCVDEDGCHNDMVCKCNAFQALVDTNQPKEKFSKKALCDVAGELKSEYESQNLIRMEERSSLLPQLSHSLGTELSALSSFVSFFENKFKFQLKDKKMNIWHAYFNLPDYFKKYKVNEFKRLIAVADKEDMIMIEKENKEFSELEIAWVESLISYCPNISEEKDFNTFFQRLLSIAHIDEMFNFFKKYKPKVFELREKNQAILRLNDSRSDLKFSQDGTFFLENIFYAALVTALTHFYENTIYRVRNNLKIDNFSETSYEEAFYEYWDSPLNDAINEEKRIWEECELYLHTDMKTLENCINWRESFFDKWFTKYNQLDHRFFDFDINIAPLKIEASTVGIHVLNMFFQELVLNALKYSRKTKGKVTLYFSVSSDDGVGISKLVFKNASREFAEIGTGDGLGIIKTVISKKLNLLPSLNIGKFVFFDGDKKFTLLGVKNEVLENPSN